MKRQSKKINIFSLTIKSLILLPFIAIPAFIQPFLSSTSETTTNNQLAAKSIDTVKDGESVNFDDNIADFTTKFPDYIFPQKDNKAAAVALIWSTINGTGKEISKSIKDFTASWDLGNNEKLHEKTVQITDLSWKEDFQGMTSTLIFDTSELWNQNFRDDWKINLNFTICYLNKEIKLNHQYTLVNQNETDTRNFANTGNSNETSLLFNGKVDLSKEYETGKININLEKNIDYSKKKIELENIWDSSISSDFEHKFVISDYYSQNELSNEFVVIEKNNKISLQFTFNKNMKEEQIRAISLILKINTGENNWVTGLFTEVFNINFLFTNHEDDYVSYSRSTITLDFASQVRGFAYIYVHHSRYDGIEKDCFANLEEIYYIDNEVFRKESNITCNIVEDESNSDENWTKLRVDLSIPEIPIQPLFVRKIDNAAQYEFRVYTPNKWSYNYDSEKNEFSKKKPISIIPVEKSTTWIKFKNQCGDGQEKLISSGNGSHFNDSKQPSAIYESHIEGAQNSNGSTANYWNANEYSLIDKKQRDNTYVIDELQETIKNFYKKNNATPSINDDAKYWDLISSFCCEEFSGKTIDTSATFLKIYDYAISTAASAMKFFSGAINVAGSVLGIFKTFSYDIISEKIGFLKSFVSNSWKKIDDTLKSKSIYKMLSAESTGNMINEFVETIVGHNDSKNSKNNFVREANYAINDDTQIEDNKYGKTTPELIKEKLSNNIVGDISSKVGTMVDTLKMVSPVLNFISSASGFLRAISVISKTASLLSSIFTTESYALNPTSANVDGISEKLVPNYQKRNLFFVKKEGTINEDEQQQKTFSVNSRVIDKWSSEPYFASTHFEKEIYSKNNIALTNEKGSANNFGITIDEGKEFKIGVNEKIGKLWINNDYRIDSRTQISAQIVDENDNLIVEDGWGINVREAIEKNNDFRYIDLSIPKKTKHPTFFIKSSIRLPNRFGKETTLVSKTRRFFVQNIEGLKDRWNIQKDEKIIIDQKNSNINKEFIFNNEIDLIGDFESRIYEQNNTGDIQETRDFVSILTKKNNDFHVEIKQTDFACSGTKKYFIAIEKKSDGQFDDSGFNSTAIISKNFEIQISNVIQAKNASSYFPDQPGKTREVEKGTWTEVGKIIQKKPLPSEIEVALSEMTIGIFNLTDSKIQLKKESEISYAVYMYIPNHKLGNYDNGGKFPINIGLKYFIDNKWFDFPKLTQFYVIPQAA